MIWAIEDPRRSRHERETIEALASEVDWLVPIGWRVDAELRLIWDADIIVGTHRFPIALRYPNQFPHSPPLVLPRGEHPRWSFHQYGDGGELCLEYGPDNWHPAITGGDMIRSAHRLLSSESASDLPVPSRHATTLGQNLRGDWMRMLVTQELAAIVTGVSEGELLDGSVVCTCRSEAVVCTIASIVMVGGYKWTDGSLPKTIIDEGFERPLAVLRLPAASPLPSTSSRSAFLAAMAETGMTLPNVAYVLVVRGEQPLGYYLREEEDTAFAIPMIPAEPTAIRLDQAHTALGQKKVALIGCGSLGSKIAASLARSGLGNFLLVDDDVMLPGNLVRNDLDWREIGFHKVDGVARRVSLANPLAKCLKRPYRLGGQQSSGSLESLLDLLVGYDLTIDATADANVFNYLCAAVHLGKKPLLWAMVFGGGYGGMIARHRPGLEPDPATMRARIEQSCADQGKPLPAAGVDYGSRGDGPPLIADDADVSVIAAHASRFAIDVLVGRSPSAFPHSVYLIGLSQEWIFDQPFDTRPIDVGSPLEETYEPPDPALRAEETTKLMQLLKNFSDASPSAPSGSEPTAA